MDQNDAILKSNIGLQESFYNAFMNPGDPRFQVMSPEAYMGYVGVPGDMPVPYGGGEPSRVEEADDEGTTSEDGSGGERNDEDNQEFMDDDQ